MDNLFEQLTTISKAGAYDAIQPEYQRLQEENTRLKRLLHDLTPGGSEFYNDPEYCAKWIRENREGNHYSLAKIIAQLKSDKSELAIMLKGEQDRVKALRDFINEVRPDNAYSMELGRVDKEIEQEFEDHKSNPDDLKDINI